MIFCKMYTIVYIALAIFDYTRCVNTVNVRKPINMDFQDTEQNDAAKNQMKIRSTKTMPNLINIDYDAFLNDFNFRADSQELQFTDFILEVAMIIKTYENKALKEIFAVLDDELRKSDNGCKSPELLKLKGYLSDQLDVLKDTSADALRDILNNMTQILKKEDYGNFAETVELVNSLYVGENDKFSKVLLALMYKKLSPAVDLSYIVTRTLRHVFFDHYCNLSDDVQRDLLVTIEHYLKRFANQRVNKDRNKNKETFGSPSDHDDRSRKSTTSNRKRRFQIVSLRKSAIINDDKSDSYEHSTKLSPKDDKFRSSSDEAEQHIDKIERKPKKHEFRSYSSKSKSKNTVITNSIKDKILQGASIEYDDNDSDKNRAKANTGSITNESKYDFARSVDTLKQTDLDKLRNIKSLVDEIDGMVASVEKVTPTFKARQIGNTVTEEPDESKEEEMPNTDINFKPLRYILTTRPTTGNNDIMTTNNTELQKGGVTDLKSLFWRLPLEFVKGDISIIPRFSKS